MDWGDRSGGWTIDCPCHQSQHEIMKEHCNRGERTPSCPRQNKSIKPLSSNIQMPMVYPPKQLPKPSESKIQYFRIPQEQPEVSNYKLLKIFCHHGSWSS